MLDFIRTIIETDVFRIGFTFLLIVMMFATLVADRLRPGLVLFSVVMAMLCVNIISPKEAIRGFSNTGMITVAMLYLVSEGVRRSGIFQQIIYRLLPKKDLTVSRANLRFLPVISSLSAFFNNTPVVVIFAPMIKNWAEKMHMPPTKFLIPLSYATILGGICTMIGTTTNLVVAGMITDGINNNDFVGVPGVHEMRMFELGKVGFFICVTGLIYLIMISKYLLPNERNNSKDDEGGDMAEGMCRMEVMPSTRFPGLGKTLRDFDFYRHYGAHVRAIRRNGDIVQGDYTDVKIMKEDILLIDADEAFEKTWRDSSAFVMMNRLGEIEKPMGTKMRWFAVTLVALMIIGATVGEFDFVKELFPKLEINMFFCAMVTTVIMAWTGMFSVRRYTKFLSWDVLITIACAFAISDGLKNSGLADFVGGYIIDLAETAKNGSNSIYIMLAALYLITNVFTELITNNAAAALAFPLALSISQTLGCDPTPFFMCICFAASASFSTPIGYQTNLIVQGVGGYKFTDFAKVGLPLNIIVFLVSVFLIPLFY